MCVMTLAGDRRPETVPSMRFRVSLFLVLFAILAQGFVICTCSEGIGDNPVIQMAAATLGGLRGSDSNEIDSLAQFAVDQHNTKENALLELVKVVKAEEQVVSGKLHHLTLEVMDAGKKKIYEAKIWVKPWLNNFKELQEFRHIEDDDEKAAGGEWESVGLEDPAVQDAARHAIKTIQQRSNSLLPYELSEVLHASVQVVDSSAKFDMFLKLKRGEKEEKVKVEVHRSEEGNFILAKMEDHH